MKADKSDSVIRARGVFRCTVLNLPGGQNVPLTIRSIVGLVPLVRRGDSGSGSAGEGAGVCAPLGMVSNAPAGSVLSGVALERAGGRGTEAAFAAARPAHEGGIA